MTTCDDEGVLVNVGRTADVLGEGLRDSDAVHNDESKIDQIALVVKIISGMGNDDFFSTLLGLEFWVW